MKRAVCIYFVEVVLVAIEHRYLNKKISNISLKSHMS